MRPGRIPTPQWLQPGLAVFGAMALLTAGAWWSIIFGPVISNAYLSAPEALMCGVRGSAVCDLASSLCKSDHILGLRTYSPVLAWTAAGLLSLAALLDRQPRHEARGPHA